RSSSGVVFTNRVIGSVSDCNKQVAPGHCDALEERVRGNEAPINGCPRGSVVFANGVGVVHDKKKSSDDCDAGDAVIARARRNVEFVDPCTGGGVVSASYAVTVSRRRGTPC